MTKTIIFDESSIFWNKEMDYNQCFLKTRCEYFKDYLKYRGYIYLNRVYEGLGMEWNPDNENICFRKENGPVKFTYELNELNTYRFIITQ